MVGVPSTHATCVTSVLGEQKLYIDHLTSPFRVENSGRLIELKPPMTTVCHHGSFKRSYGQMMLCPEGRRHWSRWGYFHQLAPGGLKPSSRIGSPAKMDTAPNWESRRATIYYIYIRILYCTKRCEKCMYTPVYNVYIQIIHLSIIFPKISDIYDVSWLMDLTWNKSHHDLHHFECRWRKARLHHRRTPPWNYRNRVNTSDIDHSCHSSLW